MRVLLTGEQGFTAQYVVPLLEAAGIDIAPLGVDLTDREAVLARVAAVAPTHVLHLAGISFVPHGTDARVYAVNTVGTLNVLHALSSLPQPPQRVVLASSSHVYGGREGLLVETVPLMPRTHYGASKLAMEYLARVRGEGLDIIITRPFNYTGRGQREHFLVPKLVAAFARRDQELHLGNIDVARDFSDVRHVAQGYMRLLTEPHAYGVYNMCAGKPLCVRDILDGLARITGHSPAIVTDPALVRAHEVRAQWGDGARMKSLQPEAQPAFEETLRWMLESCSISVSKHEHNLV